MWQVKWDMNEYLWFLKYVYDILEKYEVIVFELMIGEMEE